jgi:hypothetical protein
MNVGKKWRTRCPNVLLAATTIALTVASCERGRKSDHPPNQTLSQIPAAVTVKHPGSTDAKIYTDEETLVNGFSDEDSMVRVLTSQDTKGRISWRTNCPYAVGAGKADKRPTDDEAIDYCTWLRDSYCKSSRRNEPRCTKAPTWQVRHSIGR